MSTTLRRRRGAPPSSSSSAGLDHQSGPDPLPEQEESQNGGAIFEDGEGAAPTTDPITRRVGSRMMSQAERESTKELSSLVSEADGEGGAGGEGTRAADEASAVAAGESSSASASTPDGASLPPSSPNAPGRRREGGERDDDHDGAVVSSSGSGSMTREAVAKDENRIKKFLVRAVSGFSMVRRILLKSRGRIPNRKPTLRRRKSEAPPSILY